MPLARPATSTPSTPSGSANGLAIMYEFVCAAWMANARCWLVVNVEPVTDRAMLAFSTDSLVPPPNELSSGSSVLSYQYQKNPRPVWSTASVLVGVRNASLVALTEINTLLAAVGYWGPFSVPAGTPWTRLIAAMSPTSIPVTGIPSSRQSAPLFSTPSALKNSELSAVTVTGAAVANGWPSSLRTPGENRTGFDAIVECSTKAPVRSGLRASDWSFPPSPP